jgi:hypothetical protein
MLCSSHPVCGDYFNTLYLDLKNSAENVTYIPPRINIVLKDTGPIVCVAAMAHHTPVVG